jgi:cyclin B
MEETLLKALEHRITVPTAYTFILRALKAAHANKKMIQCSLYLLDGTLQSYDLVTQYLPSQLAAAVVFIARNHIGRNAWSPTLLKYTDYCQEDIAPVARAILAHKAAPSELTAVNLKYGSTRYGQVAGTVFICDF